MGFEELLNNLNNGDFKRSYRMAEQLRKEGQPITTIRSKIYDIFQNYKTKDRKKAVRFAQEFKGYGLENWL